MLEMREGCERCERAPWLPDTGDAVICSFECTFCRHVRVRIEQRLPELQW